MPKTIKNVQNDIRQRPLAYVVQIVGLLVIIANIWIVAKLSPIVEDLAVIATRVQALEADHKTFVPRNEIELQLVDIDRRLENIEKILQNF